MWRSKGGVLDYMSVALLCPKVGFGIRTIIFRCRVWSVPSANRSPLYVQSKFIGQYKDKWWHTLSKYGDEEPTNEPWLRKHHWVFNKHMMKSAFVENGNASSLRMSIRHLSVAFMPVEWGNGGSLPREIQWIQRLVSNTLTASSGRWHLGWFHRAPKVFPMTILGLELFEDNILVEIRGSTAYCTTTRIRHWRR